MFVCLHVRLQYELNVFMQKRTYYASPFGIILCARQSTMHRETIIFRVLELHGRIS